jgi:hypothetical protein
MGHLQKTGVDRDCERKLAVFLNSAWDLNLYV